MADHRVTNVGALLTRLRGMLGHVRKRDRETVSQAVDAILELSQRLHDAEHPPTPAPCSTAMPFEGGRRGGGKGFGLTVVRVLGDDEP